MTDQTPIDRRGLTTAQRLAEYVAALREKGVEVRKATIEGRKITIDMSGGSEQAVNPADLVDP